MYKILIKSNLYHILLWHAITVLLSWNKRILLIAHYAVNNWWYPPTKFAFSLNIIVEDKGERLGLYGGVKCSPTITRISFCSFQVDMLRPTKITGVITQGAKDFGHVQFVGSYKVAYSNDGERWFIYQDEKQKKDKVL